MNKPILLRPSGKDYLWGGNRLNEEFNKNIDMSPLAETWECSTHPDGPCYAVGGEFDGISLAEVIKLHPEFLGTKYEGIDELPILIKFIDANKDLSVQVHPSDEYAKEYENGQLGKTEMWYVLDAKEDAKLIYGLKADCTKQMIRDAVEHGDLLKYTQQVPIKKNDVFFIESGTIHAIGAGALIAEIQENSNLTYRLYDYNRVGADGKKRPLHLDKALNIANLNSMAEPKQPMRVLKYKPGVACELLCRCKYFRVERIIINNTTDCASTFKIYKNSFTVLLCISGIGSVSLDEKMLKIKKGDCVFVPAENTAISIKGNIQLLKVMG